MSFSFYGKQIKQNKLNVAFTLYIIFKWTMTALSQPYEFKSFGMPPFENVRSIRKNFFICFGTTEEKNMKNNYVNIDHDE